jgi:hypothetical protein
MKIWLNLLLGLYGLSNIIYHFVKYPGQNERIFGFEVPEYGYVIFWGILSALLFRAFAKEWKQRDKT